MKTKTTWLRISYWTGAIIDAFAALPMLFPSIAGKTMGLNNFNPSLEYRYAMYMGASLMLGWTVLLLWADRKPVERKGVLLITVVPVIAGMVLANIFAVSSGLVDIRNMAVRWVTQGTLTVLFLYSYFTASIQAQPDTNQIVP